MVVCSNGKTQREVSEETLSTLEIIEGSWLGDYWVGFINTEDTLSPCIVGRTVYAVFPEPVYELKINKLTSAVPPVVEGDIRENFTLSENIAYTMVSLGERAWIFEDSTDALGLCAWYLAIKYYNITEWESNT